MEDAEDTAALPNDVLPTGAGPILLSADFRFMDAADEVDEVMTPPARTHRSRKNQYAPTIVADYMLALTRGSGRRRYTR